MKATCVDKKLLHLNKKWIQTRRALGIKALYFILKRYYNEDYKEKILDIELHRLEATEETWELACKFLDHKHSAPEDVTE
ncbi:hypothetical protein H5410_037068 [Solanum commersonii]|uniref:Uncharacterized protein n=1 Tax=Solanum commersonii TaxID=4109 RepID=A0A9J5Y973_SOLCO|nr:hypothetical protein H5410_037068 [Solanum commersonii]